MSGDRGGLVLVVDDAPENLSMVSSILTFEGYEVRAANSGRRALLAIEDVTPDLILLDVKMPEMDGFETCVRLKEKPALKDVPIVFMSGLQEIEAKVKGFDSGAIDYVSKPFEPQELLARVATHIGLAQAKRQIAEANERLKELDRMKSSFIASVNHELRTPLNAIIGFTGVVLEGMCGDITELQEDHLKRVLRAAKHLLAMIMEIIDVSQIEGGAYHAELQPVHIPELIEEALDSVRPQAQIKRVHLEYACPEDLTILTDRRRLLQCLVNYLSNAVRYTDEGGVDLQVAEDGDAVEFKVVDTGIGFTEDEAKTLFSAFVRLQSAKEKLKEGTGLGLFVTKRIAEEVLQGTVSAAPNEERGSTFTLRIPRTRQANGAKNGGLSD